MGARQGRLQASNRALHLQTVIGDLETWLPREEGGVGTCEPSTFP